MQHVVLYFRHDIRDIIPFSDAVKRLRELLADTEIGEYVEDDMAIDGGDAEAVLCGADADLLYETILPVLKELPFMKGIKSLSFMVLSMPEQQRRRLNFESET